MKIPITKEQMREAFEKANYSSQKAANMLNVNRDTFRRKWLVYYGCNPTDMLKQAVTKNIKDVVMQDLFKDLCDQLTDTMQSAKPIVNVPYKNVFKGPQMEDAVATISDVHIGNRNSFIDFDTGEKQVTYDSNVFVEFANNYTKNINELIKVNLAPAYQIDNLWIFMLGDIVENDVIYAGQRFFIDMDVGKQVITGMRVFADMFKHFLKIFKNVHVINIPGNHGRTQHIKEASPATRNFDYLFGKMLEIAFQNNDRIEFICPDSYYWLQEIKGWRYYLHHGSSIRSWMGLPYYGVVRQSRERRLEVPFNIEIMGHFHRRMEIPIGSVKRTLVNGCWIPKSAYAWENYGDLTYPEQIIFGVSRKRPITWQFNVDLLDEKGRQEFYKKPIKNNNHKK
jgi:hypothetical protein